MGILKQLPEFQNIFEYPGFSKELNSLFGKSVPIRYQQWLYRRLSALDIEGNNAVDGIQIEKMKGKEGNAGLYSIRYSRSKENPRVIYAYLMDNVRVVLLTAFLEKDSSDYRIASARALHRLDLIKGDIENG